MTHRTIATRVLTAGLVGATVGLLTTGSSPGQGLHRPAAWLMPAVAAREPVARAAEPDPATFQSVFPTGQPAQPAHSSSPWANVTMQPPVPALTDAREPAAKKDEPTMVGRAWNSIRDTFSGTPTGYQKGVNPPDPGGPTPAAANPRPQPRPGSTQPEPRFYAAPPAYRWYGWGTTTPGRNVYSPDGYSYPVASARWYVHTGATPGAFPAGGPPALTRIAEGAEPPIYVGQPVRHYPVNTMEPNFAPRSGPKVAPPPGVMAEPVAVPAPGHGAPAVVPPRTIIMPAPVSTETYSVVPTVPVGTGPATAEPARPATPPTEADPHWQPVSGAPGTLIPSEARSTTRQADVVQAVAVTTADVAEPDWRPASIGSVRKSGESGLAADTLFELERTVRDACRTSVTVTELVSAGPRRVTVRYTAPSVAAAEEAVIAITRLPQLKPYAVEYDGKVVGK